MKDILIIAQFSHIPGEAGNGRFTYIAEMISKVNANVELVTSSFSHERKERRSTFDQLKTIHYKLTILCEPGYKKNISLKRIYSHFIFGKSLKKYLTNRKKPEVIYCAVPSLDAAKVAAEYAKKNGVHFIIDIQDLWPEAFRMVFTIPYIRDALFFMMKKKADFIYSAADEIVAVSKTYASRGLKAGSKCKKAYSVYLGTEIDYFDRLVEENKFTEKPENEIWVVYIGTLGHSYDLYSVIDALKILQTKGFNHLKFVVMGDGPLKDEYENYAKEQGVYSHFTGRLDYGKMVGILKACDIAVNPIRSGSAGSIINKVGDYAAAGLPVLNTQESQEYRDLVDSYRIGFNCINGCPQDLSEKLKILINNKHLIVEMGNNNRRLAEELFNRELTYKKIYELIGDQSNEHCLHF